MVLPAGITAEDVKDAQRRFEQGEPHNFGPSMKHDVIIDGRHYPPKAILGLATHRILGRALAAGDFRGGEESACHRILRQLGFEVVLKTMPAGWIFQWDPEVFDMATYLGAASDILVPVDHEKLGELMHLGQPIFFWRGKGHDEKERAGVIGVGKISGLPLNQAADTVSARFRKDNFEKGSVLQVKVKVTSVRTSPKDVLRLEWCKEDPILRNLPIFRQEPGAIFPLTHEWVGRLRDLDEKTNEDFSYRDSATALLAYVDTYEGAISRLPGSPVANAALQTGRAVSSIYNKVLNFRAIDPRDARKGLGSGGDIDSIVWREFYREDTRQIDRVALVTWLGSAGSALVTSPRLPDIDEASNDDIEKLSKAARKVRRGQRKFRENLLRIHQGKCAVTGTRLDSVLEACHISQHSKTGMNQTGNGLLLRSDIHALFDDGLLTISCGGIVIVAPALKHTEYGVYDCKPLGIRDADFPLDLSLLAKRNAKLEWFRDPMPTSHVDT